DEGVNVYAYGIHYAALSGDKVYDLQSILKPGLEVAAYLDQSFPGRCVHVKRHWPNDLRGELRISRDFIHARYNGFQDYPEIASNDPLEQRPPIRSLREICREARERRRNGQEGPGGS